MPATIRLVSRVPRRFHGEHCVQTAAALSFATLLGPVPMVVIGAALPIFLLWLHLSWSAILAGALLTAELPAAARQTA